MAAIRGLTLKQVTKIHVSYCPFDPKTATIREFLRRVSAKNMLDTNNKCKITKEVRNDNSEPHLEITFADKDVLGLKTGNMKLMDMLSLFNQKCKEKDSSG
ncbi:uncharacterized protein LOC116612656 [Nematostella vectensis]|uniref:uncharacterized protein LOC116612656 n=1 Tax=Nematostella vectensis TaxID=45351 RepID=UPI00138FCA70|nr:uncharacterized protein LOC116612656 [Nematostella vectensis]